jgi:hypothetical protein
MGRIADGQRTYRGRAKCRGDRARPVARDTDELRFASRRALFQPPALEALTFRNSPDHTAADFPPGIQRALPLRDRSTYQLGLGVGGAGVHWNGMTWRYLPTDFVTYSHTVQKYGAQRFRDGMTVQDWGVTYADLEPSTASSNGSPAPPAKPATFRASPRRAAMSSRGRVSGSIRCCRWNRHRSACCRECGQGSRLSSLPGTGGKHLAARTGSGSRWPLAPIAGTANFSAGQLVEEQSAGVHTSGGDAAPELHRHHLSRGAEDTPVRRRPARNRRDLCRYPEQAMGAAGGHRHHHRLSDGQRAG